MPKRLAGKSVHDDVSIPSVCSVSKTQRRQKYPTPSLRQKLKPKTKTTSFPETKATFSLETGRKRETETKDKNNGLVLAMGRVKGIFALSKKHASENLASKKNQEQQNCQFAQVGTELGI